MSHEGLLSVGLKLHLQERNQQTNLLPSSAHPGYFIPNIEYSLAFRLTNRNEETGFHTHDVNGKSKCHKLHIGHENMTCPDLKVHGTAMGQVSEDTYFGAVIKVYRDRPDIA